MAEHASQAYIGWGSILYREDSASPGSYVQIQEVTAFQPPQTAADEIEVTHFESPNRRKEFIAGMIDSGEATATINFNPSAWPQHDVLADDSESQEKLNWRFTLPGAIETIDFNAYISAFNRQLAPSDVVTVDITWRVSTVATSRAS